MRLCCLRSGCEVYGYMEIGNEVRLVNLYHFVQRLVLKGLHFTAWMTEKMEHFYLRFCTFITLATLSILYISAAGTMSENNFSDTGKTLAKKRSSLKPAQVTLNFKIHIS
ncbi:hypothetical protein IEQ34_015275 [Dendrobium chrysotoxum]|uniref:Uncharacterized protein n=1 Tax=Dendrobium chrysotoxum TaxID=161865 RepID=A0AAV7GHY3_DENCH|nr:hypothetical protein IEQ34_015275 [Dendrobium chrysotoxum]